MFKHHIDDVPKPISDLFQTNDNYHSYSTRKSQALRTPIGKSEAIYQTLLTLDHWLGIINLVKFQPMCLIYVLKTLPNYIYRQIIYHKLD